MRRLWRRVDEISGCCPNDSINLFPELGEVPIAIDWGWGISEQAVCMTLSVDIWYKAPSLILELHNLVEV